MKKSEIVVGGVYSAKISGRVVPVRVDAIREITGYRGNTIRPNGYGGLSKMIYDVTNLVTKRTTTFRSAARFRKPAPIVNCSRPTNGPEIPAPYADPYGYEPTGR